MESAKFLNPVLTLPIQHPAKEGLKLCSGEHTVTP